MQPVVARELQEHHWEPEPAAAASEDFLVAEYLQKKKMNPAEVGPMGARACLNLLLAEDPVPAVVPVVRAEELQDLA